VNLRVNPETTSEELTAIATVSADAADPFPGDNTQTETTGLLAIADLQLAVSDTPSPVRAGGTLTYTLLITNHGPSRASGFTLQDTLPNGVAFERVIPGGPTCAYSSFNRTVGCNLASLDPGARHSVTIIVRLGAATTGTLVNRAAVTPSTSDLTSSNNNAETHTAIDVEDPTLAWTSPGPGSQYYNVGGIAHLQAVAGDDVGIDRVTFARWAPNPSGGGGVWIELHTDRTAPFTLDLDTSSIPTNWNEIGVVAYDKAGRSTGGFEDNWIFIFISRFIFMPFTQK
jgi:uncharacterized repeat protein (TIGR01451 family)